MDEVLACLKKNPTYYSATVDADGNPQVRPFGTIAESEGRLYLQTDNVKTVFKEIVAHPRMAISACAGDGAWLRLNATLVRDERIEARQAALDDCPELQRPHAADDGNCEVFWLRDATATFASFTEAPRTIAF